MDWINLAQQGDNIRLLLSREWTINLGIDWINLAQDGDYQSVVITGINN